MSSNFKKGLRIEYIAIAVLLGVMAVICVMAFNVNVEFGAVCFALTAVSCILGAAIFINMRRRNVSEITEKKIKDISFEYFKGRNDPVLAVKISDDTVLWANDAYSNFFKMSFLLFYNTVLFLSTETNIFLPARKDI